MMLGTAKPKHRKSICRPATRGRDVSKRIMMEFTIVSNEIQYIVIRNSKLAGPRRSASQWINWHRKTTPTAYPMRNMRNIKKHRYLTLNKSGKNAPMIRSDFRNTSHINEPSPPRIRRRSTRTNPFSTVPEVAPAFFQFFEVELGSKLVELIYF